MNKLADEQNAPEASQDQPATDFYARITPEAVLSAAREASREANIAAGNIFEKETWGGVYQFNVMIGLLSLLESAERRAAEADRKAREECVQICEHEDPYTSTTLIAAQKIRATINNGNLSQNRETLASGDMPPGGAA